MRKKEKGRRVGRRNQHHMLPGKGIWMMMTYSTLLPPPKWKLSTLGHRGTVESECNPGKKDGN